MSIRLFPIRLSLYEMQTKSSWLYYYYSYWISQLYHTNIAWAVVFKGITYLCMHNNDVPFVVTPNCLKEDSCLVYVICVCFCIVVCFFLCLSSFCVLCIQCCQFLWIANFFECPFGVLQLLFIVSTCPFASGIHYKNPGSFSRKCRFEYNEIVDIQCSEHDVFQG